jgi:hypothetical protein
VRLAEDAVNHHQRVQAQGIMEWLENLWAVDPQFPGYSNTPNPILGGFVVVKPRWKMLIL